MLFQEGINSFHPIWKKNRLIRTKSFENLEFNKVDIPIFVLKSTKFAIQLKETAICLCQDFISLYNESARVTGQTSFLFFMLNRR